MVRASRSLSGELDLLQAWDLDPDGDRLIIGRQERTDLEAGGADPPRILVVTSWFQEMRSRLGS